MTMDLQQSEIIIIYLANKYGEPDKNRVNVMVTSDGSNYQGRHWTQIVKLTFLSFSVIVAFRILTSEGVPLGVWPCLWPWYWPIWVRSFTLNRGLIDLDLLELSLTFGDVIDPDMLGMSLTLIIWRVWSIWRHCPYRPQIYPLLLVLKFPSIRPQK